MAIFCRRVHSVYHRTLCNKRECEKHSTRRQRCSDDQKGASYAVDQQERYVIMTTHVFVVCMYIPFLQPLEG